MSEQRTLSVEACLALRELGFPQDTTASAWFLNSNSKRAPFWENAHSFHTGMGSTPDTWVRCPDPLTALRYCASLGYRIEVSLHANGEHYAVDTGYSDTFTEFFANSIDDCILQIAAYHRQQQATERA